jgi:arsenate reductase
MKPKVLFLCTGNSCRSQMAEGWARHLLGDLIDPYSAGIETHGLNPWAVKAMSEAGVDISGHRSKHVSELLDEGIELVVTVCDAAAESCPLFPGNARIIHHSFPDPPKMAKEKESLEEQFNCYRQVRDQIRDYVSSIRSLFALQSPGEHA